MPKANPIQDQIDNTSDRLQKLQAPGKAWADRSTISKIGHVLGVAGNIAGDIVAPRTMELIPGTQLNKEVEEGSLGNRLQALAQEQSENEERGANAAHLNAETPEIAPNAESTRKLQGAQTENLESETEHRGDATTPELGTYRSLVSMGMSPSEALREIEKDKQLALKPSEIPPEQQYLTEYAQSHPGSTVAQAEHQYMLDTQRPPQVAPVNMFLPGQQPGTETLTTVRPGQTVAAGAQTAAGVNSMNTPTMTQRTAAGRAETVVAMAPEVESRIDAMANKMGPIAGRWNDFMQGKVGSDDPDFAALRSDLLMMSSAVALAHAQGRLPENLREEFDRAINAPKQTPQNLKATINAMVPWLQKVQEQGQHSTGSQQQPSAGSPPPGAKIIKWDDVK
jgi:hypothetical protein